MSEAACISCRKPKGHLECVACENSLCKDCAFITDRNMFRFQDQIPKEFVDKTYCGGCFDDQVGAIRAEYDEAYARAQEVFIFFKTQRKEIPLIRKTKEVFKIVDCIDRDEAILRMAFMSAKQGFNAVIAVEVDSRKVKDHAFQMYLWNGTGSPAMIDENKLSRQDRQNQIYR